MRSAGERPVDRRVAGWCVAAAVTWLLLAVVALFRLPLLDRFWIGAVAGELLLWVVAVVVSVGAVVSAARRRGPVAALLVAAVSAVSGAVIATVGWTGAYAHAMFAWHRPGFVAVTDLARSGALGPADGWAHYGAALPPELAGISAGGSVAAIGSAGGAPALYLPAYRGIPDGLAKFVHLAGPPGALDGFSDPIEPRFELGDGWWWAD